MSTAPDPDATSSTTVSALGDLGTTSSVQYQVIAARQQHFNTLTWQVPPLSATAQSFLLATAFNPNISNLVAGLTGLLASSIAVISIHLFIRHSRNELADSILLEQIERALGWPTLHTAAATRSVALGLKRQRVRARLAWQIGLSLLGAAGLLAFILATFAPTLR